jgi:hypothetical protein
MKDRTAAAIELAASRIVGDQSPRFPVGGSAISNTGQRGEQGGRPPVPAGLVSHGELLIGLDVGSVDMELVGGVIVVSADPTVVPPGDVPARLLPLVLIVPVGRSVEIPNCDVVAFPNVLADPVKPGDKLEDEGDKPGDSGVPLRPVPVFRLVPVTDVGEPMPVVGTDVVIGVVGTDVVIGELIGAPMLVTVVVDDAPELGRQGPGCAVWASVTDTAQARLTQLNMGIFIFNTVSSSYPPFSQASCQHNGRASETETIRRPAPADSDRVEDSFAGSTSFGSRRVKTIGGMKGLSSRAAARLSRQSYPITFM